ncbi:MAG: efflux RND transporter periplasmic adaptor subunit [Phycisphaerales bacterium]|nr:efflux RND transporter periplasmic adaptor subunit [Phycisphaerales bacterium]
MIRSSLKTTIHARRRPGRVWIVVAVVAFVLLASVTALLTFAPEALWRRLAERAASSAGGSVSPASGIGGADAGAGQAAGKENAGTAASALLYTCGMHPNVIQSTPGDCPICHMKLTPMKAGQEEKVDDRERKVLYWRAPMVAGFTSDRPGRDPMGHELVPVLAESGNAPVGRSIKIDPVVGQNMGIRTAVIARGPLVKTLRTVGRVDYNEQALSYVTPKVEGWIETLHADQTGRQVRAGEPLFDVYSPRLYNAQEEYLVALRGLEKLPATVGDDVRRDARRMIDAARVQLRYLDVSDEQIEQLGQEGKPRKALTLHAPGDGVITEKMAVEGLYVMPGMKLYTIADLAHVWVFLDVYEYQLPWVRVGQEAAMTLPYIPGREFHGRVVYIYPYMEKETRVVKVRLDFPNPDLELKPGMYATVTLRADLARDAVLIPREAYIDSGTRQVAFVDQGGGKFQPRDIQVGVQAGDGMVELVYGLDAGERVVTSGQFLLDTESRLKEAVAKMSAAASSSGGSPVEPGTSVGADGSVHVDAGARVTIPLDAKYSCPMNKHPDETDPARQGAFFSSEPGRCDWCGMNLKPLEELDWVAAMKAAGDRDVAYTCVDHPHVFAESAGACPRCGKDLKPFIVAYTCPDADHADLVLERPGVCARCGKTLAPYRERWLDGESPVAAKAQAPADSAAAREYRCPMHPDQRGESADAPCPVCGMKLVPADRVPRPATTPEAVRVQVDFLMEHYLALQQRFASDRTTEVALHALGLVAASDEILKRAQPPGEAAPSVGGDVPASLREAVERLRAAAVRTTGKDLDADRATFVELSNAMRAVLDRVRPDAAHYPKLYIYHCPMTKGDWIQETDAMANPFYGFKMLKCGELKETK